MDAWELEDFLEFQQVRRDDRKDPLPDFFWANFFATPHFSANKKINIAELPMAHRKLAPFVMPSSQGKPVFERRSGRIEAFEPAYTKMRDVVRVVDSANVQLTDLIAGGNMSQDASGLATRWERYTAEVADYHLRALDMTRCMMAAEAFINGSVTVKYAADQGVEHPEVVIDFGRDPSLNEVLSSQTIDDPDFPLVEFLSDLSNTQYNAKYGGRPSQWIVGSNVAPYVMRNKQLLELLDVNMRGGESTQVSRGMFTVDRGLSKLCTIGGNGLNLEVFTYKDTLEAPNGDEVDLFSPNDGLLIAPGAGGIMAYGAIWDVNAFEGGSISAEVFQRQFIDNEAGARVILTQSAPLAINTNPNKVSKQTLL